LVASGDFEATGQQLNIYSAFVKYLKERENYEAAYQLITDIKKAYVSGRREVLCNILIQFGIHMNLVRLIRMCLTETYSSVWVGKNLSDRFCIRNGLKQGDNLLPFLSNFGIEYAIRSVQVIQFGFKLIVTLQFLVCADDINLLGGSVHTVNGNGESLVMASRESGLEVNADKTKYMVLYRDQNAGRINSMKVENRSLEIVEEFNNLLITLTKKLY